MQKMSIHLLTHKTLVTYMRLWNSSSFVDRHQCWSSWFIKPPWTNSQWNYMHFDPQINIWKCSFKKCLRRVNRFPKENFSLRYVIPPLHLLEPPSRVLWSCSNETRQPSTQKISAKNYTTIVLDLAWNVTMWPIFLTSGNRTYCM